MRGILLQGLPHDYHPAIKHRLLENPTISSPKLPLTPQFTADFQVLRLIAGG